MNNGKVIFTLMGKGGVGKTLTSTWLHQYIKQLGYQVTGFDTDPVNATYDAFKGLDTHHINIFNERSEIDKSPFDELIENQLINLSENSVAIVDCGGTSFNPMMTYLDENKIIELLAQFNVDTLISIPVVGGPEHNETLKGLVALHDLFNCQKIVWLNHFFGEMPTGDESPLTILPKLLGDSLTGIVDIPDRNIETFGKGIREMQKRRMTFDEFHQTEEISLMMRNRVNIYKNLLFDELSGSLPFDELAKS